MIQAEDGFSSRDPLPSTGQNAQSSPRLTGNADHFSGGSNVVTLPTAAKRKVRNPGPMSDAARSVEKLGVTYDYSRGARKPWEEASFMRSPEMIIITAMFKLLPDEAKAAMREKIGVMADMNASPHAASAAHILDNLK